MEKKDRNSDTKVNVSSDLELETELLNKSKLSEPAVIKVKVKGIERIAEQVRDLTEDLTKHFKKFEDDIQDTAYRYQKLLDVLGMELKINVSIEMDNHLRGTKKPRKR